ncbi:hypothetical protein CGLO_18270 [Colletotrichum gloeosporioides Cg-14]|uniref:Uncharacterized protein n=1 Tax=Colletotrichum gloeosporioides (strain Cg-14) TaxID=1237896 RepID=T0JIC5_COLGC|nr:hypothetical protein CGLO_18270 [Colletotrichum gloeosporioides Cg-14]
MLSTRLVV